MHVCSASSTSVRFLFFFNDTATTEIYTLSLHDALPILLRNKETRHRMFIGLLNTTRKHSDRKSGSAGMPRPNSYAVFCLKKKRRNHVAACFAGLLAAGGENRRIGFRLPEFFVPLSRAAF